MSTSDEYRDRLIDVLLREHFQAEQPPDLVDRILAHARPPQRPRPSRIHRRALAVAAVAVAAAVLLIVASVLTVARRSSTVVSPSATVAPKSFAVAPTKPSTVSPKSSTVVRKTPRPAAADRLPVRQPHRTTTTAPRRPLISATVRVPTGDVRPFRIPARIPIPTGRVKIPRFSVKLPPSVSPFTITKKRSLS